MGDMLRLLACPVMNYYQMVTNAAFLDYRPPRYHYAPSPPATAMPACSLD